MVKKTETQLAEMHVILLRLDKAINGNGHPGVIDEVNNLKGKTDMLENSFKIHLKEIENKKGWIMWMPTLITACCAVFVIVVKF